MNCIRSLPAAMLLAAVHFTTPEARAQCDNCTGICAPASQVPVPSPRQGVWLPSAGVINALVVFIDFADDTLDINNANWPRGQDSTDPVGIGPSFMNLFIDRTSENPSGRKFNVTTYYKDMSGGRLQILGHPFYRRARRTYAQYLADSATMNNIPYWATREVLESLRDQDVGGWEQFDRWKMKGNYDHSNVPDGKVDLIIIAYRGLHNEGGNGWLQEGWAHLGGRANYVVGDTLRLTVNAGFTPGSGLIWQEAIKYPDVSVPLHEVAHYLLGTYEFNRDPCGGLWTALGGRQPNVSNCMNAYERDQLGWITVRDATDGMETDLPDFATSYVAARIISPGYEGLYEYYFENHQNMRSPYITVAEDGVFSYDVVDRTGKRGLYIIERDLGDVKVVCADGRWKWDSVGAMPNPGNPAVTAHIFKRSAMDRVNGLTDRRPQPYLLPSGLPAYEYMWAWRDERTNAVTWMTHPRNFGDSNDAWAADADNVFSPWSNPAARFVSRPTIPAGAAEVIRENSDGSVRVKFSIDHPENAPPSRPQDLRVHLGLADGVGNRHPIVRWEMNIEPDVKPGGEYEVWRLRSGPDEEWELAGRAAGDLGVYEDIGVSVAEDLPQEDVTYRYRVRVKDTQELLSAYSEDDVLVLGAPIGKRAAEARELRDMHVEVVPNPSVGGVRIVCRLREEASVMLRLFDAQGRAVREHVSEGRQADKYELLLPTADLATGMYYCVMYADGVSVARVPVIVQ